MSAVSTVGAHDVVALERALARLATRQGGVVGRAQVLALGFDRGAIDRRIKAGRLIAVHRGVYAVGHADVGDRGRVIAAGPGAVASHRTAAALWELIPSMPAVLEVTVPSRRRRNRRTLLIHETRNAPEPRRRHGIPPHRAVTNAGGPRCHAVGRGGRAGVRRGAGETARAPTGSGGDGRGPDPLRARARLPTLVARAGLPAPAVNQPIGRYLADFVWPDHRVIVETDGYAVHGHRAAFERDRVRDARLQAAGYVVLRFTHRQITREPLQVVALLAQTLSRRS